MGCQYEEGWHMEVVDACVLRQDILAFPNGDKTVVGDRGVQCSGGQKARIGLERAVYCDSEVLLLDDPLSAVDSKVARELFTKAIMGLAVRKGGCCVVLVTHQHQFVGDGDCCTLMEWG
eukprot:CAMPEP_0198271066 /NCGR_PEP_ID=MMETSP1447-20131203/47679_1 /TAXON_ID=420782 /ORGANISM="Chaetoceros dichaeta, Strain CCMP1751" /LENGTH=118 /DNA_ID=CAMNT_0043963459 /DNA_START=251 /DNA_END=607 /DNA_ORIENTATION=-